MLQMFYQINIAMKRFFAIVVACAACAAVAYAWSCCDGQKTECADRADAVIETIMTRTSIRAFTDQPVEDEKIDIMLRAGMAAPTAVNKQPWAFVVVKSREQLDRLQQANPYSRMLATAQLAIVVCGDMTKAIEGPMQSFWIQDASAATENILLAAHALGLGAVWTGVYPHSERVTAISEVLGLPSYAVPLCVIPMGYPAESPEPKDKWNPENVHYDRW